MSKKKTATTKTATTSKPKYYIVMDSDMDLVFQGEWDEIEDAIKDYIDGMDEVEVQDFISDITIHELGAGKQLNFTPAVVSIK